MRAKLTPTIIKRIETEAQYGKALKQLRSDTKKYLAQAEADCGCSDAYDTDTMEGWANYLLNKFLNLTAPSKTKCAQKGCSQTTFPPYCWCLKHHNERANNELS